MSKPVINHRLKVVKKYNKITTTTVVVDDSKSKQRWYRLKRKSCFNIFTNGTNR